MWSENVDELDRLIRTLQLQIQRIGERLEDWEPKAVAPLLEAREILRGRLEDIRGRRAAEILRRAQAPSRKAAPMASVVPADTARSQKRTSRQV